MILTKALLARLADQVVELVSSGMAIEYAVAKVWKDNNIPDVMYSEAREQASKVIEEKLGWSTIENVGTRQKAWDRLIGNDPVVREQIAKASARARLDLTKEVGNIIKNGEGARTAAIRMQAQSPGDLSSVRKDIKELAKLGADQKQIDALRRKITSGLKGNDLKDAYRRTLKAIESGSQEAIDKQLKYAVENKVRYNMNRVVRTEQNRAVFEATREEIASNPNIGFVRFVLAGGHEADECDAYANADMGYGKGVYPITQAPVLPIHPNGRSILVPLNLPKKTNAPIVSPAQALTQQAEEMGVRFNGPQLAPIVRKFPVNKIKSSLDHGVLNTPLSKRGDLNQQADAFLKQQKQAKDREWDAGKEARKIKEAQERILKDQAKESIKMISKPNLQALATKYGKSLSSMKDILNEMVITNPKALISLAKSLA